MRSPHLSVSRVPRAADVGAGIANIIDKYILQNPDVKQLAQDILHGKPISKDFNFPKDVKGRLRNEVLEFLSAAPVSNEGNGISPEVIEAYCNAAGDPDAVLAQWLRDGAPIGIKKEVVHTGVFPAVAASADRMSTEELFSGQQLSANHASAALEADIVLGLLRESEAKHHCRIFNSFEELVQALKTKEIVINPFGLVTKFKEDGTTKYRVIWDLKASQINKTIHQGERIVLPGIQHVVGDILALARDCQNNEGVWMLCYDISDAFNNIPVDPSETPFTCAKIETTSGDFFVVFDSLVFGSGSSPTVWGRFAAWLGRSTAAIIPSDFRQEIYVDDPVLVAKGSFDAVLHRITTALIWADIAGFPVAWHKAHGGKQITWIGASISIHETFFDSHVSVSITEAKIQQLEVRTSRILGSPVVSKRELRSYAGSMSFVAGLVKFVRPFLSPLWAAISDNNQPQGRATIEGQGATLASGSKHRRTPDHLVKVRRVSHSLRWVRAFLQDIHGPLCRNIYFEVPSTDGCLRIAVDASPWGIGGILLRGTVIIAFFSDEIQEADLRRFRAMRGVSDFNTLWEALAILVAVRIWRTSSHDSMRLEVRSDSLGVLRALQSSLRMTTTSTHGEGARFGLRPFSQGNQMSSSTHQASLT